MIHDQDENELNEPFYLARVVGQARKLAEDCLLRGNEYKKGHLVVNIKWYCYLHQTRGDRVYRLQPGGAEGIPYSVQSMVKDLNGIQFKTYSNGKYTLARDSVKKITRYVNFLTNDK